MLLLLTLRGTPFLYYGDELGMRNVVIPPERIQDPQEKNVPGLGLGRDPSRTPMQWDDSANAGFCPPDVEPWLPVDDSPGDHEGRPYEQINVKVEREDAFSMLTLTRELLALRRSRPALHRGSYAGLESGSQDCFVYLRKFDDERLVVALNFSDEPQMVKLVEPGEGHILLSTALNRKEHINLGALMLDGHEGCIIELNSSI
jgi:alpha-glucosidase